MDKLENINARLNLIIEKIEKLKKLDDKFTGFGSRIHQYEFNNKLTKEDIKKYENENNITLPLEYAEFLINIGNGGAGPCYGVFSLKENENMINLSEQFPYDIENPFYIENKYDEYYEQMDNCKTIEEEDNLGEELDEIKEQDYLKSAKGFIDICHEGCAIYNILIINGKDNGTVWFHDFANDFGTAPLINPQNGQPMTFIDWYEFWVDEQIKFMGANSDKKKGFGSYNSYIKRK